SRGVSGLFAALLGIAIVVFGMTWRRLHVVARTAVALVGLAVFVMLPRIVPPVRTVGTAFFPEEDRGEFIMSLETPPGSNLEYTRLKPEEAANIARALPETRYTYTTLGGGATGTVDVGHIDVKL